MSLWEFFYPELLAEAQNRNLTRVSEIAALSYELQPNLHPLSRDRLILRVETEIRMIRERKTSKE
jgi:hypothetical protein